MEKFPKVGMRHEQVRERLKKYDKQKLANPNLKTSLLNQVVQHEGVNSANEIAREFNARLEGVSESPTFMRGSGKRQHGIGPGVKGSSGHYEYIEGKWTKV